MEWRSTTAALTAASKCSVVPASKPVVQAFYSLDLNHVYSTDAPGLAVSINGRSVDLEVGNGDDARILLTRSLAESLHLPHDSPDYRPGVSNALPEYYTHIDRLRVGDLEYRNCPAVVADESLVVNQHGTIPVSFFKDFVVTLDFPKRQLRLDTLPEPEGGPVTGWSQAAIGGPEVRSRIAGDWAPGPPAIPREKRDWMHAYMQGAYVFVPVALGPNIERLFLLEYMSGPSRVLPSTARAATPVAKDTSLSSSAKAALKGARYSLRTGEIILPVDNWNEVPGLYAAGTLGESMREMRVTLDFRDALVKIQHSAR